MQGYKIIQLLKYGPRDNFSEVCRPQVKKAFSNIEKGSRLSASDTWPRRPYGMVPCAPSATPEPPTPTPRLSLAVCCTV